mgnify:CR=1 FL=1
MRIAETLDDLHVGTPIEIHGVRLIYKGIVCEHHLGSIIILFSDMSKLEYYQEDLNKEEIMILVDCK